MYMRNVGNEWYTYVTKTKLQDTENYGTKYKLEI